MEPGKDSIMFNTKNKLGDTEAQHINSRQEMTLKFTQHILLCKLLDCTLSYLYPIICLSALLVSIVCLLRIFLQNKSLYCIQYRHFELRASRKI